MSYFKRHIFFCCNDRGPGANRPSCAQCGGQEMRDYAKAKVKELGMHEVRVALHPEVSITVTANVARTPEEAEIQAEGGTVEQDDTGFAFDPDINFDELGTLPDDEQPRREAEPAGDPGEAEQPDV